MKRNLHLFLILLISIPAFSQNWAPINTTEKFCYSTDGDNEIVNNVLWVDSTKQMGDHEIYYFNKIVAPCDTCADTAYMLMNQPQFLLDYAKVYDNGEWIFESADRQFKILPHAQLNDVWTFDESNGITAEVLNLLHINVIGEPDSIKIIHLSNDHSFVITKNHGILQWYPPAELIGIEGRNIGTIVPKFEDMFSSLETGDVLCYYTYSSEAFKNVEFKHNYLRYEITNIENFVDSIIIDAYYHRKYTEFEYGKTEVITYGDTVLTFYPNPYTEAYPNEPIFGEYFEEVYISKMGFDSWGGITKTNSVILLENGFEISTYLQDDEEPMMLIPYYDKSVYKYPVNYGFMEREIVGFEWAYSNQITGYLHNGDTLGEIYPIEMFVGTNQLSNNSNWLIYPNPAKEYITIKSPKEKNIGQYKLYNLNGILLKEGVLNQAESKISVKEFPEGMYFIELNINGELTTKKWIKN